MEDEQPFATKDTLHIGDKVWINRVMPDETIQPYFYTVVHISNDLFLAEDPATPGICSVHSLYTGQRKHVKIDAYNYTYRTEEHARINSTKPKPQVRQQLIEHITNRLNDVPLKTLYAMAELVYGVTKNPNGM